MRPHTPFPYDCSGGEGDGRREGSNFSSTFWLIVGTKLLNSVLTWIKNEYRPGPSRARELLGQEDDLDAQEEVRENLGIGSNSGTKEFFAVGHNAFFGPSSRFSVQF